MSRTGVVLAGAVALAGLQAALAPLFAASGSDAAPPTDFFDALAARGPLSVAAALGVLLVVTRLAVTGLGWWLDRGLPPEREEPLWDHRWGLLAFGVVWLSQPVVINVGALAYQGLLVPAGWPTLVGDDASIVAQLLLQAGVQLGILGAIVVATRRVGRWPLGLVAGEPGPARQLATVCGALVLFVPIYLATYVCARTVYLGLGLAPKLQVPVQKAMALAGTPGFAAVVLMAVVAAPLFEELLFRGMLYGALRRHCSAFVSAVASAMAFSVLHVEPLPLIPLFAFGLLLAALRERTGSLLAPVLAHALFNGTQLALMVATR